MKNFEAELDSILIPKRKSNSSFFSQTYYDSTEPSSPASVIGSSILSQVCEISMMDIDESSLSPLLCYASMLRAVDSQENICEDKMEDLFTDKNDRDEEFCNQATGGRDVPKDVLHYLKLDSGSELSRQSSQVSPYMFETVGKELQERIKAVIKPHNEGIG